MSTEYVVTSSGVDIAVRDHGGTGRPVVLLHGGGRTMDDRRHVVPPLTEAGPRVVTVVRLVLGGGRVRAVRTDELPVLREIEHEAGEAFRAVGMPEIADDEAPPLDVLETYRRTGRARVAVGDDDRPVAYLLAAPVDGLSHVEQVSVRPSAARRGIGRSLIDHLGRVAATRGVPALTLTTFADVPWNAPYYERCGFRRLAETELTDGLRAIRAREAAHGLDRWPRVCMRLDL